MSCSTFIPKGNHTNYEEQSRQTAVNRDGTDGRQRTYFQRQRDQERNARVRRSGGGDLAGPSGHASDGMLDELVSGRERDRQKGRKRRKRKRESEKLPVHGFNPDLVRFGALDIMDFDKATAALNSNMQEKKHRKKNKKPRSTPKEEKKNQSINRTFAIDAESDRMHVYENDIETSPPRNHATLFGAGASNSRKPPLNPGDRRDGRRDRKRRRSRDRSRNEQELKISPSGRRTAHLSQRAHGSDDFEIPRKSSWRTANVSERAGEEEFALPRDLSRRAFNESERATKEEPPPRYKGRHRTANVSERKVKEEFAIRRRRPENVSPYVGEEEEEELEIASSPRKNRHHRSANVSQRADEIEEFAVSPRQNRRISSALDRPETQFGDVVEPTRRRHRSGHRRDPRIYSNHDPPSDPKYSRGSIADADIDADVYVGAAEISDAAEVPEIHRPRSVRREAKSLKDTAGKGRMLFAEFNPAILAREIRMFKADRSTGVFQYPPSKFRMNRLVSSPRLSPKKPKSPTKKKNKSPRKKGNNNNVVVKVEKGDGNPFARSACKSTAVSIVGNNNEIGAAIDPLAKDLTNVSIKPASPGVSAK